MKQINSDILRQIINEAVSEIVNEGPTPLGNGPKPLGGGPTPLGNGPKPLGGGPKPLGGLNAPKPLGKPGAGQAAQGANSDLKSGKMKDGTFLPRVEYAYYEKWWEDENPNTATSDEDDEILKIGLNYIYDQHIPYLLDKWGQQYSDIFTAQGIRNKDKGGPGRHIQIRVKPGKEQDFEQVIPAMFEDIKSLSETVGKVNKKTGQLVPAKNTCKYSVDLFPKVEQMVIDYIHKAPSKNDTNAMEMKIAQTWKELLSNMQDPATLQKLQNIGGAIYSTTSATLSGNGDTIGKDGFSAGHQLSMQNRLEIFSQDPNATFVTQEFVWRDLFNRKIVDPNQKIIITKSENRKPKDAAAFEKACINCGFSGSAEFSAKQKSGNLSTQQLWAVRAAYNKLNPADAFFVKVVAYDYANTELMTDDNGNPLEDVFNNTPGLSDNIKGIPNQAAARADQQLAQQTGQQFVQGKMQTLSDPETEEISKIIAALTSQKAGRTAGSSGNVGDDIVNNSYIYASILANGINFSKPEYEEAYKQSFAAAVAATYGFTTQKGAAYLRQVLANRGVDKELSTMINLFFSEYKAFIVEINRNLAMIAKKLKKSGVQVTAPVSSVQQSVNEEGDTAEQTNLHSVNPLTPEQLSNVLGVPAELFTGGYEIQDDVPQQQELQESFFNMLDRIELV